jgi:4-hydroxyphenylpyruvate dioxygenase-like putative hemolysin
MIDTTVHGFVTVQAPITFKENKNPKYDKLGGRTLYWLQDVDNADIFLWDNELNKILATEEDLDSIDDLLDDSILGSTGTEIE